MKYKIDPNLHICIFLRKINKKTQESFKKKNDKKFQNLEYKNKNS